MEELTPQCPLDQVRALVNQGQVETTNHAITGAAMLGFDFAAMVEVVLSLTMSDFHKSMTTHADHRVWQDVYRPTTTAGPVYLKLTEVGGRLRIISLKEL